MSTKRRETKKEAKLMETEEIVNNMDTLYHIKRNNQQERDNAIKLMNRLIELIKEKGLDEVYFTPTELIINSILCYNNEKEIYSQDDREICEIVMELGYMRRK